MEFTHIDTSYEPSSISYSEMFSWQGVDFPKRSNKHDEFLVRQKRHTNQKSKSTSVAEKQLMFPSVFKATVTPEEGVFVIAENVSIISEYLYGSSRVPFRANRRIFIIAITKPEEGNFDKHVKIMLRHLWDDYAVADVILITPCNNDPDVCVNLISFKTY